MPVHRCSPAATLTIDGSSVLEATVRALRAAPAIGRIVLALQDVDRAGCLASIERPDDLDLRLTDPAPSHWLAVQAALAHVSDERTVLLHEANRPLLPVGTLTALIETALEHDASMLAVPMHDSVKRVADGRVVCTIPRETLHVSQTPTVFRSEVLVAAVERALREGWTARNEVDLALAAGADLRVVEGQRCNVQIVSQLDASYAEISGRLDLPRPVLAGV